MSSYEYKITYCTLIWIGFSVYNFSSNDNSSRILYNNQGNYFFFFKKDSPAKCYRIKCLTFALKATENRKNVK